LSTRGLAERLQALVDADVAGYPQMPGRLLHVLAAGGSTEVAAGVANRQTREPLAPGSRFRIASTTKPFVAAAALRLVEQGRLDLDAAIAGLLPSAYVEALQAGGYGPEIITLRQLLTHTSGIYDFAADAYDSSIQDGFVAATRADPKRRWTRLEQVVFAMEHGEPYGAPGTVWAYSDTGACLVGEIIEGITGQHLGASLRELCSFERLGLTRTYLESVDPDPQSPPPLAHAYEDDFDVARYDASVDLWGGGGLVSTCADLAIFFRALLRGEVFERDETVATMCTLTERISAAAGMNDDPTTSAMFLFRAELGGEVFWGHGGYWGTAAYTCPDLDLTVVTQHGQAHMPEGFDKEAIIAAVVELLR
jgi:D-alanyl-D-alanine carboxypeptidase